jgi:hypothetical protein
MEAGLAVSVRSAPRMLAAIALSLALAQGVGEPPAQAAERQTLGSRSASEWKEIYRSDGR